jgi:hypothetical protein
MKHAIIAITLAAGACGAFAQAVQSSTQIPVTSGTGVAVTPGVMSSTSTVTTAPAVASMPASRYYGATTVQYATSESVSGNQRTVVTKYWANVPAGVERDANFQRWQRLK